MDKVTAEQEEAAAGERKGNPVVIKHVSGSDPKKVLSPKATM